VLDWTIPDDITVAYLNSPFIGGLFDAVTERLIASVDRNPRRLWIVYMAPHEHERLSANPRVTFMGYGRHRLRRWRAADYLRLYRVTAADGEAT
jgi:hypothetical protein